MHVSARKHVHVQMENGLPCACAGIDNCAIAVLCMTLIVGDACTDTKQVAEQTFLFLGSIVE